MKSFLIKLSSIIDSIIDRIGSLISWLTVVLMIIICIDVIMRYLFNSTKTWVIELEWHLFSIIFLIGASYTLLSDQHVRVDVFYERFGQRKKNIVNILGISIFLIPWAILAIYYGFEYAANSFSYKESSAQPNGLPARYIIKSIIPIGFFLLLIQGISKIIRHSILKKD